MKTCGAYISIFILNIIDKFIFYQVAIKNKIKTDVDPQSWFYLDTVRKI